MQILLVFDHVFHQEAQSLPIFTRAILYFSGGVERKWTGVPRLLYIRGSNSARCVCVENPSEDDPSLKKYDGCPSHSESCFIGHD